MNITIATIPVPNEDPNLFWKWKFYIVDGKLATMTDSEAEDYEAGFIDGVTIANPDAKLLQIIIGDFDVANAMIGDNNPAMMENLSRLIPLGTPVQY